MSVKIFSTLGIAFALTCFLDLCPRLTLTPWIVAHCVDATWRHRRLVRQLTKRLHYSKLKFMIAWWLFRVILGRLAKYQAFSLMMVQIISENIRIHSQISWSTLNDSFWNNWNHSWLRQLALFVGFTVSKPQAASVHVYYKYSIEWRQHCSTDQIFS